MSSSKICIPEKPYEKGSWGYIGGEVYKMKGNGPLPYGSNKNILGTENDAMYETQRTGIEQFKLDVPDGYYELTLHFAELTLNRNTDELVYNLSHQITQSSFSWRSEWLIYLPS